MSEQQVIITGDPVEGFNIIGPFAIGEAAVYAENARFEASWWVAPLHAPSAELVSDDQSGEMNCRHEWNQTDGEADENGTRIYCLKCGADGDA